MHGVEQVASQLLQVEIGVLLEPLLGLFASSNDHAVVTALGRCARLLQMNLLTLLVDREGRLLEAFHGCVERAAFVDLAFQVVAWLRNSIIVVLRGQRV